MAWDSWMHDDKNPWGRMARGAVAGAGQQIQNEQTMRMLEEMMKSSGPGAMPEAGGAEAVPGMAGPQSSFGALMGGAPSAAVAGMNAGPGQPMDSKQIPPGTPDVGRPPTTQSMMKGAFGSLNPGGGGTRRRTLRPEEEEDPRLKMQRRFGGLL